MSFDKRMPADCAKAFLSAAKLFHVFILVRRTNEASVELMRDPACVPKRIDCKAKTADQNYVHPGYGPMKSAGLVVDPTISGESAFKSGEKYGKALKEWEGFAKTLDPAVLTFEGQSRVTYIPGGKQYFVDLDPKSVRYGCVKFTSIGLLTAGKYIHGDFDLYGIVPAADPAKNVSVTEERLGMKHMRSPEFMDVQNWVNRQIGVPMVLHGAQEGYASAHSDEGIDIFHPDGRTITFADDAAAITRLYETDFKGRKLFTKGGTKLVVRGMFMTPG